MGAVLTLTAYWVLGIPLAWYLALYKEIGTKGLWIGPTAACAYLTLTYNILIMCINWQQLFNEVRDRRDNEKAEQNRRLEEQKLTETKVDDDFTRQEES